MKKLKNILIIVLVFTIVLCTITYVFCKAKNIIFTVNSDLMKPIINEGDDILCKPVQNANQLCKGDIITFWTFIHENRTLAIGEIGEIYIGDEYLIYEVKDYPVLVHQKEIEGQFIRVLDISTLGIFAVLFIILMAVAIFIVQRSIHKKALAESKVNDVEALQNTMVSNLQIRDTDPMEIMQYKELLDTGVITQEEFDTKKKQLLEL